MNKKDIKKRIKNANKMFKDKEDKLNNKDKKEVIYYMNNDIFMFMKNMRSNNVKKMLF